MHRRMVEGRGMGITVVLPYTFPDTIRGGGTNDLIMLADDPPSCAGFRLLLEHEPDFSMWARPTTVGTPWRWRSS